VFAGPGNTGQADRPVRLVRSSMRTVCATCVSIHPGRSGRSRRPPALTAEPADRTTLTTSWKNR
jgi:hypothetical protein